MYTTKVSAPFPGETEETTTFATETLEVVPAFEINKTEEVTMETTETTETSEVVSDVPFIQEMETETEEVTTQTTVTTEVTSMSSIEASEGTTMETSEVVFEKPSTQDMVKTEETTMATTVTEMTSAPSTGETVETTTFATETLEVVPAFEINKTEEITMETTETTETSEVVSDVPFIQEMETETEEVTTQTTVTTEVTSMSSIEASEGTTMETSENIIYCEFTSEYRNRRAEGWFHQESDNEEEKKRMFLTVTAHLSDETRSTRAAAAWGKEVGSYNVESAHMRDSNQALMLHRGHSLRLAFDNITCAGQVTESSKKPMNVVKSVTGYADSGTLAAIVGAGRAGKSALLSALAGEKDPTMGRIFYEGNEVSAVVRRRVTGFCWFGDEHVVWHGTTTVHEALSLSAYLRQGDDVPESRKLETIGSCLKLLGLTDLAGQYISSCSAVEARLVAIGVELAFAPSILLLDEPTSGLDADSAQRIVRVLEQVARTGHTVVCSIADLTPTTEVRAFDRLVLLSRDGETIFHGETRLMVQYLEALPGVKGLGSGGKSITAWALESVGVRSTISLTITKTRGCEARTNTKKKKHRRAGSMLSTSDIVNCEKESRFVQLFQRSEIKRRLLTQMQRAGYLYPNSKKQHVPALITAYRGGNLRVQASSWYTQMTWLVRRVWSRNAWRENACWRREQAWQAYPAATYHFCSSVVELVFVLGITLVAAILTFTLFGFWSITKSGNFALYWFTLAIFALGQVYLAQWLVRLVPSESIAAVAGIGINLLPLLTFVWSWRRSAVSRLMSLLVSLTPQHYALQVMQALVFGAAADSYVYDGGGIQAERELPCRDLRLIPSDERYFVKKLTVFSYAEIKYGAERGSVALRLFELGAFLAMFRFLAIVALKSGKPVHEVNSTVTLMFWV
ncbi:unnamed protein product [Peronospora destructor]|uniref:ABC transporter domain-containing protein n=1 Tax=Peronospora destructor TaxID=86335 RepID=A0AAV0U4F1_9STRA|nr:unnamed protein product [Peronospora destructor]